MDRIYARSEEKIVKTTILYISQDEMNSAEDSNFITVHAYADRECTRKVDSATLRELFFKGVVFYVPARTKDESAILYVYAHPTFGVTVTDEHDMEFFMLELCDLDQSYKVNVAGAEASLS